jgi:hypothetical protein
MRPYSAKTEVNSTFDVWYPASFKSLLDEVRHIQLPLASDHKAVLFRGHKSSQWLLDSTFVRSIKQYLFGLAPGQRFSTQLRQSADLHHALAYALMVKFGSLLSPSEELNRQSDHLSLDRYFELLKWVQQHPEEDKLKSPPALVGTNFIDFSRSLDIALYFANDGRADDEMGALYVLDTAAAGAVLIRESVESVFQEIRDKLALTAPVSSLGLPLFFCPPRQVKDSRADNQQAFYVAQMDLRFELEFVWRQLPVNPLVKLILPKGSVDEISAYLRRKGITDDFVYPKTEAAS